MQRCVSVLLLGGHVFFLAFFYVSLCACCMGAAGDSDLYIGSGRYTPLKEHEATIMGFQYAEAGCPPLFPAMKAIRHHHQNMQEPSVFYGHCVAHGGAEVLETQHFSAIYEQSLNTSLLDVFKGCFGKMSVFVSGKDYACFVEACGLHQCAAFVGRYVGHVGHDPYLPNVLINDFSLEIAASKTRHILFLSSGRDDCCAAGEFLYQLRNNAEIWKKKLRVSFFFTVGSAPYGGTSCELREKIVRRAADVDVACSGQGLKKTTLDTVASVAGRVIERWEEHFDSCVERIVCRVRYTGRTVFAQDFNSILMARKPRISLLSLDKLQMCDVLIGVPETQSLVSYRLRAQMLFEYLHEKCNAGYIDNLDFPAGLQKRAHTLVCLRSPFFPQIGNLAKSVKKTLGYKTITFVDCELDNSEQQNGGLILGGEVDVVEEVTGFHLWVDYCSDRTKLSLKESK